MKNDEPPKKPPMPLVGSVVDAEVLEPNNEPYSCDTELPSPTRELRSLVTSNNDDEPAAVRLGLNNGSDAAELDRATAGAAAEAVGFSEVSVVVVADVDDGSVDDSSDDDDDDEDNDVAIVVLLVVVAVVVIVVGILEVATGVALEDASSCDDAPSNGEGRGNLAGNCCGLNLLGK
jgi:hypothetical protein